MVLLWFLLGILAIFLISRYNESNKIFWVLFVSFIGGFTAMSMISKTTHTKDKKNVVKVNHYTQALASESNCYVFNNLLAGSTCDNTCEANVPKLVGYNDLLSNNILYYQDVCVSKRIVHILPNPPNNKMFFDTS